MVLSSDNQKPEHFAEVWNEGNARKENEVLRLLGYEDLMEGQ